MEGRKIVKSYTHVWRLNRSFYSFGGMDLPLPLSMNFMLYFIVAVIVMHLIGGLLPAIIRYLVIPLAVAWIFDQRLIDGKNPFQFIRSISAHYFVILTKGHKVSRFKHYKNEKPAIKSNISYRIHRKALN